MKNLILKSAIASVLLATSVQVSAEVVGNFGVASSYLWRGVSLSEDAPAVSGGIDYSNDSGLYAGIWQSSEGAVGSDTDSNGSGETDLYVGFSGEAGDIGYDVGFISYQYLQNDSADFEEIYVGITSGNFGASAWIDSDNDNTYITANATFDKTTVTIGSYDFDDSTGDYAHFDVSYDMGNGVAFTFSKNDLDTTAENGDGRFVISWTKDLDMK